MGRILIIPVENQVRELDAKLLLSFVAAKEGFTSYIGSRRELEYRLPFLPRGIYLSKSMTARSLKMFRIMSMLGHRITAWDEEALVHPQEETYFSRRLNPESIRYITDLFAWGEDNAQLWRSYPYLPESINIHVTGNPRGDMLRPELKNFFSQDVQKLRKQHGEFLLINTNFSFVNPFFPEQGLLRPDGTDPDGFPAYGRAAVGMERNFVHRLHAYKKNIFEAFQHAIPLIAKRFPETNIIVRPHPVENPSIYHEIAGKISNVKVINEGNVIPWILASTAVIHNGCTTGIEAYMLEKPALSYLPVRDELLDNEFYRLPNMLSHRCFSAEELLQTIESVRMKKIGAADGEGRRTLLKHYLSSLEGPLACELIVECLKQIDGDLQKEPMPAVSCRLKAYYRAAYRWAKQKWKAISRPDSKYRPEFQRHRFPELSIDDVDRKISLLSQTLGDNYTPHLKQISPIIFRISP